MEWYHLNVKFLSFFLKKELTRCKVALKAIIIFPEIMVNLFAASCPASSQVSGDCQSLKSVFISSLYCFQLQKKRIDNCDYENTPDTASQAKTKLLLTDSRPPPVTSNICAHRPSFPWIRWYLWSILSERFKCFTTMPKIKRFCFQNF